MLLGTIGAPELILILVIVLVVFGSTQLPRLAKSLGQAHKEFKKGAAEGERSTDSTEPESVEENQPVQEKAD